ncbi:TRAP transporter substrate-binding protein [Sediminicurvatus halobius]|uniref:C4-dicarboxylate ABC transporter substrate-binding protein n=1 Tax=Sediminicurvatus halobius TaxID=2182432 RepID=A0A2U2N1K3_9GAMM|nr:TRAP transporter substrate-binding protein [Spiribacter halobius]PWG62928.1 C4-dicarboxylate ABC transporter substrate-binding protein [Spiribacter halobius]UEX77439.1 TRAP transporter substrate-binding protein [Spiribacter halobius]
MRRLLSIALAAGLAASGTSAAQSWNMATPYPDATFHTQNVRDFVADIEDATDGALSVTVHSAGSLIRHPQIKRGVRTGQVQMGEVFISLLGSEDPVYAVDSIPFLATSYEDAERLWEASREPIESRLEADGLMLLYAVPWPAQGLYTSREVDSVEDLEGLRFRAYNAATSRLAELTGMEATQVEVPEIPQAFSTGIVEAMITSPTTGVNSKAWDFVDRFYDIQAWLPKNMVIVNREAFESLGEAEQAAVLEAAAAAEERGWRMSREEAEAQKAALAENGMEVVTPSDTLREQLAEIGRTMTEEWLEDTGADGEAIIEAYRAD